ncbi:hypothetical protein [Paenarthrobacter sp. C1]|uniref:hypothetical protein n=1 Tax=Paenarthrobacter sp. C1 TaxID=3400220 RepID=UPI003BF53CEC
MVILDRSVGRYQPEGDLVLDRHQVGRLVLLGDPVHVGGDGELQLQTVPVGTLVDLGACRRDREVHHLGLVAALREVREGVVVEGVVHQRPDGADVTGPAVPRCDALHRGVPVLLGVRGHERAGASEVLRRQVPGVRGTDEVRDERVGEQQVTDLAVRVVDGVLTELLHARPAERLDVPRAEAAGWRRRLRALAGG